MGNSVSCCFISRNHHHHDHGGAAALFADPLDEGLGHSFCYIRPVIDSLDNDSSSPNEAGAAAGSGLLVANGDPEQESNQPHSIHEENNPQPIQLQQHLQQHESPQSPAAPPKISIPETSFKSISGASVSANSAAPRSIVYNEQFNSLNSCCFVNERAATFESTPSFCSLPLQPIPRGISISGPMSGPLERGGCVSGPLAAGEFRNFLSGPLERGFMSGPIERAGFMSGPLERSYYSSGPFEQQQHFDHHHRSNFSAPLVVPISAYLSKQRRSLARAVAPVKKALTRTVSNLTSRTLNRSVVAPMKSFSSRDAVSSKSAAAMMNRGGDRDGGKRDLRSYLDSPQSNGDFSDADGIESHNLHWAQGKAGEDRVHVVLSEEHGWLFVGIYDGFSGPDATDFLMSNLYPAIYKELKGLLWDQKKAFELPPRYAARRSSLKQQQRQQNQQQQQQRQDGQIENNAVDYQKVKDPGRGLVSQAKVSDLDAEIRRWDAHHLSFGVEDGEVVCNGDCDHSSAAAAAAAAPPVSNGDVPLAAKPINMRSLSTKFRKVYNRRKRMMMNQRKLFQCRYEWEQERMNAELQREEQRQKLSGRRGPVNHAAVLKALARALEATEESYLEMIDEMFDENPELALMGSCVLVMLMKDEDVYIMNVGDSRAVLAQQRKAVTLESLRQQRSGGSEELLGGVELERIVEETPMELAAFEAAAAAAAAHNAASAGGGGDDDAGPPAVSSTLGAVQLSVDHSTKILEEAMRIRLAHPDDTASILNERVKGKLAVTRAFGAGYLKQAKWNDALLEVFRIEFVGSSPYISCIPHLHHHKLCSQDQFIVLSSDGIYQYLTNDELVSHVEWFMEKFPDGDPAQYLIEVVLFRAAKKAGMEFHDLLDIPQGDRRKYHDDLSLMVVSLEGRIWRSSSQGSSC